MAENLFKKLLSIDTLKKAWHYVCDDARDSFMPDFLRYQDFEARLDDNLKRLSQELSTNSYQPQPLLQIDIPKSTLTVRPGSVLEVQDHVVVFAIMYILAPIIDSKMSEFVYSSRLKKDYKKADQLFENWREEDLPFLKRENIRNMKITEDWPYLWPEFDEVTKYYYEKEGYTYMAVSDISAYFENINHHILRDQLLRYVKSDHRIVNLLMRILGQWAWCSEEGLQLGRGIPQGNEVSSFIGTMYLMPVDEALEKYAKTHNIKFARYMDDIKIFTKNEETAREALLLMNQKLRDLHLNIQGSKTAIHLGEDIKKELFDERMERLNEIIDSLEKEKKPISKASKKSYEGKLQTVFLEISKKKKRFKGKEIRLFKRLITGYRYISHPRLVGRCIKELRENPDLRLNESICRYFKLFPKNRQITKEVSGFLLSAINKFEWQEAVLISALKYSNELPTDFLQYLTKLIYKKNKHWFVRVNAILALTRGSVNKRDLEKLLRLYDSEESDEVRRALLIPLGQLESKKRSELFERASFDPDSKINRTVHFLRSILEKESFGMKQLKGLERKVTTAKTDEFLSEDIYKLFLLKDNPSQKVQARFHKLLKKMPRKLQATIHSDTLKYYKVK